ncbi:site-specific integrase [Streptomyces sp. NBC_00846]|uniref:tyrosine-type recombinase/integrase n=1 Tax=Streptomyces sp. NBC_00846 TaxID=2975849 RepID=UPI0038655EE0|nr:site-specific integrase [Streptomyces sp. NBC_00846]
MTDLLVAPAPLAPATHRGEEAAALLRAFPPRASATSWPATEETLQNVVERLQEPPLRADGTSAQHQRLYGARVLLAWLESLPGDTWQQRWDTSPASASYDGWQQHPLSWAATQGRKPPRACIDAGMLALICADAVRPCLEWLCGNRSGHFRIAIAATRDPEGFACLAAEIPAHEREHRYGSEALKCLAQIVAANGGGIDDIRVGDLLVHPRLQGPSSNGRSEGIRRAYAWLRDRGQFPPDAPTTLHHLAVRTGKISPAGLIDRYQLRCRPIRDLLVDYLTERQPAVDYGTLRMFASYVGGLFWADLERHNPGLDTLRLPQDVSDAWKARLAVKTVRRPRPDGTTHIVVEPRKSASAVKITVRAFYLDLAEWALDQPERWGRWAAPCPISEAECETGKEDKRKKSWSDQRTRERLPVLPVLVRTAERRLREARARLDAVDAAPLGSTVTIDGESFTLPKAVRRTDGKPGHVLDASGSQRNLRSEEKNAFFAWATIEILRHTGIRIEELRELSHHSIVRYKLPTSGEIVPLLQIAPSKTDKERLLLISPELADALSAVVSRIRKADGTVPSISIYDKYEKTWNAAMPILFQWAVDGECRPISENVIRRSLNDTLKASGLVDKSGEPLHFQPHDFRRIFITDAVLNGLPPHIAQVIAGHDSINSTMGYAAIYPVDAIESHRAFIARRRQTRPSEEYRAVTPEEWDEFLSHFERRKLALGDCGRAYGTDCIHEHACVRCPVLIVGPTERPRLEQIRSNLNDRIAEAEREGWLGDVEQLGVSVAATEEKIAQIDAQLRRKESPVFLCIPALDQIAGRTS